MLFSVTMFFSQLFSGKAYFKVCYEVWNIHLTVFACQFLLLSTIIINDEYNIRTTSHYNADTWGHAWMADKFTSNEWITWSCDLYCELVCNRNCYDVYMNWWSVSLYVMIHLARPEEVGHAYLSDQPLPSIKVGVGGID